MELSRFELRKGPTFRPSPSRSNVRGSVFFRECGEERVGGGGFSKLNGFFLSIRLLHKRSALFSCIFVSLKHSHHVAYIFTTHCSQA